MLLWALAVLSLGVTILYTLARFTVMPYTGLQFATNSNEIVGIEYDPSELQIGDAVLQVEGKDWEAYSADRSQPRFTEFAPGQEVHLLVERDGQATPITWVMPVPDLGLYANRVFNIWLIGLLFWISAMLTLLTIRPRDTRWMLLAALFFLTSMWLAAGSVSQSRIWYSALVYRALTWPTLVVACHFHWVFPITLGRFRGRWPQVTLLILYGLSGLLALATLLQLVPAGLHILGVLLALAGSLALLVAHAMRQPATRPDLRLLAQMLGGLLVLIFGLNLLATLLRYPPLTYLAIPSVSIIPLSYFYIAFRRQPQGMEVRASRLVAYVSYALGFLYLALGGAGGLMLLSDNSTGDLLLSLLWLTLLGLFGIMLYRPFRRWFERRALHMPIPSDEVVAVHARLVSASPSRERLAAALEEQVFPSLLIRQAAVLELIDPDEQGRPRRLNPAARLGVTPEQLPTPDDIPALRYRPISPGSSGLPLGWVRLVLPLEYQGRAVGLCLLGRRDPDDLYSAADLPILRALLAQTALALVNTGQAELIRSLQRHEIEHQEEVQRRLAQDLHDDVLGQMTLIAHHVDPDNAAFHQAHQAAMQRVRDIISGLRPTTLAVFGLYPALQELIDELEERAAHAGQAGMQLSLEVPASEARYPAEVELAVYRIVQQAGQNAIKHAQAAHLAITGVLQAGWIALCVEDDGQGFAAFARSELTSMLVHQHFGLLDMYERAELAGAKLEFDSAPGEGTRVRVGWEK